MTVRPKNEDLVRAWVLKAEHDLLNIENNLVAREIPWDTVVFHAQQCGEKYLKALLVSRQIDPPKIHDLTELYALLPDGLLADFNARLLEELNPYSIEGRYPGVWEPVEQGEALRAVEAAKTIRRVIRRVLPSTCIA
ncbi:MAG: HEPN domain-containing protein [Nitrospira sp.]|nr:HEPN domain-containing protein [Nitrospira sp.]MDH4327057.1 HEPN domain-containing protein [Nitrospira sp.]MDH5251695.1 HEPN domain-containing protein [Nitrospira sp.]